MFDLNLFEQKMNFIKLNLEIFNKINETVIKNKLNVRHGN
jgi:hypothetical protein